MTSPSKAGPEFSVVICTHNRAGYLDRALESVAAQDLEPSRYEVLVVDNRSTDDTVQVVERSALGGKIRYVFESTLGLCHARNRGWREARGRYVVFLDDDAVASPGWLRAVEEAFATYPGAGVVGGRVDPIWEAAPPTWMSPDVSLSLTILDWGPTPKVIADLRSEWLVGANLAIPRGVLEDVGGFHPGLDRVGTAMLSSGDVFLEQQIVARGYLAVYYPTMAVSHVVPASRLRKGWFRRRYYWQGISDAVMRLIATSPSPGDRLRLAFGMLGRLLRSPNQLRDWLLPTDDPARFTQKCWTWIAVGHIAGLLGAARR
jgi:glycosyltransferase involved in cell wall biosynthesis